MYMFALYIALVPDVPLWGIQWELHVMEPILGDQLLGLFMIQDVSMPFLLP